jgi:hypothetical protein
MTAYIGTEEDVLAQLADSLAAALIMTECAVAVFEAQSTHTARRRMRRKNYPEYLEPTVSAWRPLYENAASAFPNPPAMAARIDLVPS